MALALLYSGAVGLFFSEDAKAAPPEEFSFLHTFVSPPSVQEGETGWLYVYADNLPLGGGTVDVSLTVDADHADDVSLARNTLMLTPRVTPRGPSRVSFGQVRVRVLEDGLAELRETVRITVSGGGADAVVSLTIPSNGYAVQSLRVIPSRLPLPARYASQNAQAFAEIVLNAPLPSPTMMIIGLYYVTDPHYLNRRYYDAINYHGDRDVKHTKVMPGTQTFRIEIPYGYRILSRAGVHGVGLYKFERYDLVPRGDQEEVLFPEEIVHFHIMDRSDFHMRLLQAEVTEGKTAQLEVRADNLSPGETLDLSLTVDAGHAGDVSLEVNTLTLTAGASSRTVRVRVLEDGLPEPLEVVRITGSGRLGASALAWTTSLTIPRNDLPVQLRAELSKGTYMREGESADLNLYAENLAPGETLALNIIVDGEHANDVHFSPGNRTKLTLFMSATDAGATVHQLAGRLYVRQDGLAEHEETALIMLRGAVGEVTVNQEVPLIIPRNGPAVQLQTELSEEYVREGETARLGLRADNLLPGDVLDLRLAVDARHADDVSLEVNTLTLTADASSATVRVRVLPDGLAEPRETAPITASGRRWDGVLLISTASLRIPRHGSRVQLHARVREPLIREGETTHLEVHAENMLPGEVLDLILNIVETTGYDEEIVLEANTLTLTTDASSATVKMVVRRDRIDEGRETVLVTVHAEHADDVEPAQASVVIERNRYVKLRVHADNLKQRVRKEGWSAQLQLQAERLREGERLELRLSVDEAHAADLHLATDTVTLTGGSQQTVRVDVLEDGLPEPRERARVTATPVERVETASQQADIIIPRHGYAVQSLRVVPSQAHLGTPVFAEVVLNAPPPPDTELNLRFRVYYPRYPRADGSGLSGWYSWVDRTLFGAQSWRIPIPLNILRSRGEYEVQFERISFPYWWRLQSADQQELEIPADAPRFLVEMVEAASLAMRLSQGRAWEGDTVSLEVRALNLLDAETATLSLTVDAEHADDASLEVSALTLTADASSRTVRVRVLDDSLAESLERVRITASGRAGAATLTETVVLKIPRNDHPVRLGAEISGSPWHPYSEGETAQLQLRAYELPPGAVLDVSLAVDAAHTDDVSLERSTLTLTAEEPYRWIRVDVLEDGLVEPRETAAIRASAEGVAAAEALLAIPRHGYALKSLRIRGAMLAREDVQVEAELNAPAPTTARLWMEMQRAVPDAWQWTSVGIESLLRLQIAPGRTTGSVAFSSLLWSGGYRAFLRWDPGFQSWANDDQIDLLVESSTTLRFWLSPQPVTLWAELEERILMEGGTMTWRVGMRTDASKEFWMDVEARNDHPQDVELREPGFRGWWRQWRQWRRWWGGGLHSSEPLSLEIRALEDGLAEPRETVLIRVQEDQSFDPVTGVEVEAAEASFVIPRNGYTVRGWHTPRETPPRQPFAVAAWLNAPAPVTAVVTVQLRTLEGGVLQTEQMRIGRGARLGSVSLSAPQVGRYEVEAVRAVFVSAEAGDQSELRVLPGAAEIEAPEDWAFQLSVLQEAVAEGETGRMEVRAFAPAPGEVLAVDLRVAEGAEEDVRLATERVELTAGTPTVQVEFLVLEDGLAEPREEAGIRASAPGIREAWASVSIPRHGYAVSGFGVSSQELLSGEALEVELELNAAPPERVHWKVEAQILPDGELQEAYAVIAPDARTGSLTFRLRAVGHYRVHLLDAAFASWAPGDQQSLLPAGAEHLQTEVEVRPRPVRVELELEETVLPEGGVTRLRVSASGLLEGEEFRVRLQSDVAGELRFAPAELALRGPQWSERARVRVLRDGVAELEETLRLSAELAGAAQLGMELEWGVAELRVPGNGYAVERFEAPDSVEVWETVQVHLELNTEAPAAWEWLVEAQLLEEEGVDVPVPAPGVEPLRTTLTIAAGERRATATLRPQQKGLYEVSARAADTGGVAISSPQSMLLQALPKRLKLHLSLDRDVLVEGRTATLTVSMEQAPAGETVELALSRVSEGVELQPSRVELRAGARTATVSVHLLEGADASDWQWAHLKGPYRTWMWLAVRGAGSADANWVAPLSWVEMELLHRVPPTAPQLQGRALGPYQMQLSWTFSDRAGEPLVDRQRYTLLYTEASGGVCPASVWRWYYSSAEGRMRPWVYRPAAEAASYTSASSSGWRMEVSGEFVDGVAVQAETAYCFVVQAEAAGSGVRTQPLQLRTPAYNPDVDQDADGLPDHLAVLCGASCANMDSPQGDADGDGINNVLEAYLRAMGGGTAERSEAGEDAYSDADGDYIPDIIELRFGGRVGEQRRMDLGAPVWPSCDAGAYLTRAVDCREELEGMRLLIVMNAQGRGVYQGGAEGLSGGVEVDGQTRLGSGTHWLLDRDGRVMKLRVAPLLSLRGSDVVALGVEGTEGTVQASYMAEVSLQGPLPRGVEDIEVRVCRLAAAPDFVFAEGLELGLCGTGEEEVLRLDTGRQRHAWKWEWNVSVTEDAGKRLRVRAEVLSGSWASVHSFKHIWPQDLPELEAELWFAPREMMETGLQQKLVPCLVDEEGDRTGSVGNGEAWRFKTEPAGRIAEVKLICATGMVDGEEQVERRFADWDAPDEEGVIVLDAGEAFEGRVVRAEFYASEAAECGVRSGAGEGFLGELSFLVGEKDADGNLVPDEEEGGETDVAQTGEKGLLYRLGRAAGEEVYYLRSRLSLRLGLDAAAEALGTPNLVEGAGTPGAPEDSLQALDGVLLDFETFCAADPECLRAGEPVQVVFEMRSAIPEDAEYYKLRETEDGEPLWCPLVMQYEGAAPLSPEGCPQAEGYRGRDGMSFAAHGRSGECPGPGSKAYRATGARGAPYLDAPQAGERCVQLTLTDNGPNDDNPLSGVVADPIGIFERVVQTPQQTAPRPTPVRSASVASSPSPVSAAPGSDSGGGGGGGGGGAVGWPLTLLLAALLGLSLHRRRLCRN